MSSIKRMPDKTAPEIINNYPPTREAERVRTFFQGLFKIVVAVSTLGASFTFTFILTDIRSPNHPHFDGDQLVTFLAMSWLLFIVALIFACLFTLLLNFWGDKAMTEFYTESKWHFAGFGMSVVLLTALVGAFIYICLVITAYQLRIGIAGICFAGVVWIMCLATAIFRLVIYLSHIRKGGRSSVTV
jgi:hypothetical protein